MVDAGVQAQIEVFFRDLAGEVAHIGVTYARVVRTLRRRETFLREAERLAILEKEIFLLEAEPGAGIVMEWSRARWSGAECRPGA